MSNKNIIIKPNENLLEDNLTIVEDYSVKPQRNFSWKDTCRLPKEKLTVINGITVYYEPGSSYHGIVCGLLKYKDEFCSWYKIFELVQFYMEQHGGKSLWRKFVKKKNVKSFKLRIKENTHILTRSGRTCFGYKLHERGLAVYYFRDGALIKTGGSLAWSDDGEYDVVFPDNCTLQKRYRGIAFTFDEYIKYSSRSWIDSSCNILNYKKICQDRIERRLLGSSNDLMSVVILLQKWYNQDTANRFEREGLLVEHCSEYWVAGKIPFSKIHIFQTDPDVKELLPTKRRDHDI